MRKYNWEKLKAEFFTGEWLTIKSFFRDKGIPTSPVYPQVKGWAEEKKKQQKSALMAAAENLLQQDIVNIQAIRLRQARTARFLQLKGAKALENKEAETVDDARKLIVSGLEEERRSLGMEGGITKQTLTQININPKTNLDKLIEKLDYEGILELIAELKRLGTGSTSPKVIDGSTGEVENRETI